MNKPKSLKQFIVSFEVSSLPEDGPLTKKELKDLFQGLGNGYALKFSKLIVTEKP